MIENPKSLSNSNGNLLICKRKLLFECVANALVSGVYGAKFIILAFLLFAMNAYSQTVLISPTGDGGFETGATLAANNWSATVGTAAQNQWIVGTGATAGFSGTRAAYITNNTAGTPPPHTYTLTTARVTHLYRTVAIPAGQNNIVLSFSWIGVGEAANDRMRIFVAPSSAAVPVYGTAVAANATALPGGTRQVGSTNYSAQATWTTATVSIPEGYAGSSIRLIFEWTNNNNAGTSPPIAVDNISLVHSAFTPPSNDNCLGATTLTVNPATTCTATTNGTSVGATAGATACAGSADDDVWYSFVATQASHIITVTPTTMVDVVFQGYSGTCASLVSMGCVNATTGNAAETGTFTGLTNGATYYVRIHSAGSGENQGTFTVCLTTPAVTYCTPSTTTTPSTLFINNFRFLGTLNDVSNLNTSYGATGYQNFTANTKSIQAQGEGMNVYVETNGLSKVKAWVDWNKDGDFDDAGETVYNSGIGITSTTFGFIVPATISPGDYRIRIRNYKENVILSGDNYDLNFTPCEAFNGIALVSNRYGEAEDYTFAVVASCSAHITSVTDGETCGNGTVALSVTGSSGVTEYRWYAASTGGAPLATTTVGSWTTPTISTTTVYYVTAYNGCESLVRTAITAVRSPVPDVVFTPTSPVVCGEDNIISLSVAGDIDEINLINEHFESGLGVFANQIYTSNPAVDAATSWQTRTSTYIPAGQVWFPAVSSGFGSNKFVMATSDVGNYTVNNGLVSPVVNSTGYLDLTLTFKMYYSHYQIDGTDVANDYATVDVSIDGGTNWIEIIKYTSDVGIGTRFQDMSINLSTYINRPNLRIRIRYHGVFRDGIAVDNVRLYGNKPLNTAFKFTSGTPLAVFTDALATIPYNSATMTATTVYIKPTLTQLENASFTITANATLSSGCIATKNVVVTNNSKIWSGAATNWNTAASWKPVGVPTATNCVIVVNNSTISGTSFEAYGRNLNVKSTGNLTVNATNTLTVTEAVKVDTGGNFILESTSSLVQINNTTNTGNIKARVNTKPMRRFDYTYWSTPVASQMLGTLSPLTLADKYYSWNTTTQSWLLHASGNISMTNAKGYIVRAPQTFSTTAPSVYPAEFSGVPNNGTVSINVLGNSSPVVANYQWNLIGNPYPSAISANSFLSNASNASAIDGTIYLWTHNTTPSRFVIGTGVFNYSTYDYATYNLTGGVGVAAIDDPNDPTPSNNFNSTVPTGYIASGQAFFVRGLANLPVQFLNTMRVKGFNNEFFRAPEATEKSRLWLNLSDHEGAFNQMLVGYVEGATNEWDRGYDGEIFNHSNLSFYTVESDKKMTIQARAYPFNDTDVVKIGYKSDTARPLYISIDHVDESFENKSIYIKDNLLGTIHDITESAYSFTTQSGTFDDRLEIVYRLETLGVDNPSLNSGTVLVYKKSESIIVKATTEVIHKLKVVDLQGRLLYNDDNVDDTQAVINGLPPVDQVLIVQITTQNGAQIFKKIIY
ncbi:GEVED domain-containing protein [uncultured Flavobacterium sp.]|uniref:GEVED domain-containing protein n=1 Tax=uncultured Flavobacterium sp. TaxID=165435 RepID=UPI0025D178F4|nr:GEVED domain-containing protein [uncultured Flavobacterium sp.]